MKKLVALGTKGDTFDEIIVRLIESCENKYNNIKEGNY